MPRDEPVAQERAAHPLDALGVALSGHAVEEGPRRRGAHVVRPVGQAEGQVPQRVLVAERLAGGDAGEALEERPLLGQLNLVADEEVGLEGVGPVDGGRLVGVDLHVDLGDRAERDAGGAVRVRRDAAVEPRQRGRRGEVEAWRGPRAPSSEPGGGGGGSSGPLRRWKAARSRGAPTAPRPPRTPSPPAAPCGARMPSITSLVGAGPGVVSSTATYHRSSP